MLSGVVKAIAQEWVIVQKERVWRKQQFKLFLPPTLKKDRSAHFCWRTRCEPRELFEQWLSWRVWIEHVNTNQIKRNLQAWEDSTSWLKEWENGLFVKCGTLALCFAVCSDVCSFKSSVLRPITSTMVIHQLLERVYDIRVSHTAEGLCCLLSLFMFPVSLCWVHSYIKLKYKHVFLIAWNTYLGQSWCKYKSY